MKPVAQGRAARFAVAWVALALLFAALPAQGAELVILDTGGGTRPDLIEDLVQMFQSQHPGVEVLVERRGVWETLEQAVIRIAAGNPPDLVWASVSAIEGYAAQGVAQDLTPWIERDAWDVGGLHPELVQGYQSYFPGEQIALPFTFQHHTLYYNGSLFDASGLARPARDWHWDEFVNIASTLTQDRSGDGVPDQYGVDSGWWNPTFYVPLLESFGGRVYNDDRSKSALLHPDTVRAFEALDDLINLGYAAVSNVGGLRSSGALGMWYGISYGITDYIEQLDYDWGITPLPREKGGQGIGIGDNGFWIPKASNNKDLAWEFLKLALGTEGQALQVKHNLIPVRLEALQGLELVPGASAHVREALLQNLFAGNVNSLGRMAGPHYTRIIQILNEHLPKIQGDEESVTNILSQAADLIDVELAKPWPEI